MNATDGDRSESRGLPFAVAAALLALLCAASSVNSCAAEFAFEDYPQILENPRDRWYELTLDSVRGVLAGERPITHLTFGLNYYFGRRSITGYHAVNAAIHLANGLLVYALGLQLFGLVRGSRRTGLPDEAVPWAALAGAAIFAAHPLQVESVTYVAQRSNELAALFSLSALLLYLRGRSARGVARTGAWIASGACWLLALGSRETALVLPIAIGLCEWLFVDDRVRRSSVRRLFVAVALSAAAAAVWIAAGGLNQFDPPRYDLAERLWSQPRAIALYESLAVFPAPARLNLVHDLRSSRSLLDPPSTAFALAFHLVLLGAAIGLARRWPIAAFAVLWFYLWLAVDAFLPVALVAEHRTYLALAGPALAAGFGLFAALPRRLGLATALAVAAVTALGAATHARNEVWRSAESLWSDAIEKSPDDPTARTERGALLAQQGRPEEAIADFAAAVSADPRSALARLHLSAQLTWLGRASEALPHAEAAVALDPSSAAAQSSLGRTLAALGRQEEAAVAYQRSVELRPDSVIERRLADSLMLLGRFDPAIAHYQAAIALDPGDDDARTGLGAALVELGRPSEAVPPLEHAVESQPSPRYMAHLGDALWQLGDVASALGALNTAVRFDSNWPGATSRLAWMLAVAPDPALRDPARALRIADAAIASANAPVAILHDARAAALAAGGHFDAARAEAERAAEQASAAGDARLADAISARARGYAKREIPRDPPRPFEPSP